jgi:hypothetical protein
LPCPWADLWSHNGITPFDMVDFKKEDQITQVTDPSAGFAM